MCNCGQKLNQTHGKVIDFFSEQQSKVQGYNHRYHIGTGVFGIPDPETGIMEQKKIFVKDITYDETVKRGANCLAYLFVPNELMSFDDVTTAYCGGPCQLDCSKGGWSCICGPSSCY